MFVLLIVMSVAVGRFYSYGEGVRALIALTIWIVCMVILVFDRVSLEAKNKNFQASAEACRAVYTGQPKQYKDLDKGDYVVEIPTNQLPFIEPGVAIVRKIIPTGYMYLFVNNMPQWMVEKGYKFRIE